MLSDVFTDKAQFDWMLSTFLNIYRSHPAEDELTMQYLVIGICKAAAVIGVVSNCFTYLMVMLILLECQQYNSVRQRYFSDTYLIQLNLVIFFPL